MDRVLFHMTGESLPVLRIESGVLGKPLGPVDPKSEVVIKRNTKPEMMKMIMNFVLEMFIYCELYHFFFTKCRYIRSQNRENQYKKSVFSRLC